MAEYTPEIADRLFVWPNFANTSLYRDYGQSKAVPVLLSGSQAPHYPGRNEIGRALANRFPTYSTPHFGWFSYSEADPMVFGETYARLLNSAKVVPTCGTIAKEVVRKHFEIPAARSCLVTEQTPSIEAAGFEDGVNCVFATRSDVVERVSELLSDSDLLAAITDAGHELVQSRHRMIHRSQIHDWYVLNRSRGPNETIVRPRSVYTARIDETQR